MLIVFNEEFVHLQQLLRIGIIDTLHLIDNKFQSAINMSANIIVGYILNIFHSAEMSLQISDLIQPCLNPVEYIAKLITVKPLIDDVSDN